MRRGADVRGRLAATGVVLAIAGCLYSPPHERPSSIRILYSKTVHDSAGSETDVWFLVAREGNEIRLTADGGDDRQPDLARRDLSVYFTRRSGERDEIWTVGVDGQGARPVLADSSAGYRDPAVSPDETRLAFTRAADGRSEIVVAGLDGGAPRTVVSGRGWRQPAWAPDGRTLAVVGERDGVPRLFAVDADGGEPRELAPAVAGPQTDPDWSPDGSRIALTVGSGREAEIAVLDPATGEVSRLTDDDVEDGHPSWSPAGERIVFVRRADDRASLWIARVDGGLSALTEAEDEEAADPEWL